MSPNEAILAYLSGYCDSAFIPLFQFLLSSSYSSASSGSIHSLLLRQPLPRRLLSLCPFVQIDFSFFASLPPQFPAKLNPRSFTRDHLLFHSRAFRLSVCFPILFERHIYSRAAGSSCLLLLLISLLLIDLAPQLPALLLCLARTSLSYPRPRH